MFGISVNYKWKRKSIITKFEKQNENKMYLTILHTFMLFYVTI